MSDWDPTLYEADPKDTDLISSGEGERVAVIRTSDRILFKRCRRRWHWGSHLKQNLGPIQTPAPLWTGVGFHYALEDFHGQRIFPSAAHAFKGYALASSRYSHSKLPSDWQEQSVMAMSMLHYYEHYWLAIRDPLRTLIWNGVPQLEVGFKIDVPFDAKAWGYDRVIYSGTLDRVVIDDEGNIWIVEYKTAKAIQTMHFANDPQISAYTWIGNHLYGQPIAGVIYQQHLKHVPEAPRVLANGTVSTDSRMRTTRGLYRNTLVQIYGSVEKAPIANVDFLNELATKEDSDKDLMIRRDRIFRNKQQADAEGIKLLMELEDMLNPNSPPYPNPTRDCAYMCSFSDVCVSMDDGSDWKYELSLLTQERDREYDLWRKLLPKVTQRQLLNPMSSRE